VVRRTGDGLEPIYVGSLSREAITLRPALADPVPLLLGSAVRPLQFDGPAHDLVAVTPNDDITDIVRRCVAALDDGVVETELIETELIDHELIDHELIDNEALDGIRPRRREPAG
jgi:hypothetical protein